MQARSDIEPIAAWDGGRRLALALSGAADGVVYALVAHGPETTACVAVAEAAAGPIVALLPRHALHLDLTLTFPDGGTEVIALELDPQLAPAMADPGQAGLSAVAVDASGGGLARLPWPGAEGVLALNVASEASGGRRLRIGPVADTARDGMVTTVSVAPSDGGLMIGLERPGGASPVLVALIPADRARLGSIDIDATGATGPELAARGFAFVSSESADAGSMRISPFSAGDVVQVLSPRHHRISIGAGRRPGTRLTLTAGGNGEVAVELTTHAYRAATSTALAALSGGALAAAAEAGGGTNPIEDAPALAEAWWKRARIAEDAPSTALEDLQRALSPAKAYPQAALTLSALAHEDAGVSPLTAAVGSTLGLPPALIEETEALSAGDRAALAAWAALAPETAGAAARQRILLPSPTTAGAADIVAAADAGDFRARVAELVERLGARAATLEDRQAVAALRELADPQRVGWIALEAVAAALETLRRNPPPADSLQPTARLLASLKQDGVLWADIQKEARAADLAAVAERRSNVPAAAADAGLAAEALADLAQALPRLTAAEILLLERHFAALARRRALLAEVKQAVLGLDEAAGAKGLSARIDRSGDPLLGMTRIGSASEPVVRQLLAMPQARDALVALLNWINGSLPSAARDDASSEQLVRNLKSYGCFLLMHAIAAECRSHAGEGSAGASAFMNRLGSGLAETLPRLAATAAARTGDDMTFGLAFTGRLPHLRETRPS